MSILPACTSVYYMPAGAPEAEEGLGNPETRITDGQESPDGCWELNAEPP